MSTNIRNKTGHETGQFGGMADKARETAGDLADKARETATDVAGKARDMASSAATTIGKKADDAASAVGGGMKSLADTIRENAPNQGVIGKASSSVAGALEHSGRHLQEDGFASIGDELTRMIRRNPLPSLLVGIGIGFLLARATRS